VLPIDTAYAFDLQEGIAESYAEEMAKDHGIKVTPVDDLAAAAAYERAIAGGTGSFFNFFAQSS